MYSWVAGNHNSKTSMLGTVHHGYQKIRDALTLRQGMGIIFSERFSRKPHKSDNFNTVNQA